MYPNLNVLFEVRIFKLRLTSLLLLERFSDHISHMQNTSIDYQSRCIIQTLSFVTSPAWPSYIWPSSNWHHDWHIVSRSVFAQGRIFWHYYTPVCVHSDICIWYFLFVHCGNLRSNLGLVVRWWISSGGPG